MLRFVLLLLYLFASYSTASQTADYGAGYDDPDGASLSPPAAPTSDAGGGYDPNG